MSRPTFLLRGLLVKWSLLQHKGDPFSESSCTRCGALLASTEKHVSERVNKAHKRSNWPRPAHTMPVFFFSGGRNQGDFSLR